MITKVKNIYKISAMHNSAVLYHVIVHITY